MKFRCERDLLVEGLATASRAAVGKTTGSVVLSGVHLSLSGGQLRLLGNDRDLSIETEISVSGTHDGVAVVPARLAAEIVRALEPGAVNVEVADDESLRITAGRSQFSIRTLPADEFPRLAAPVAEGVSLDSAAFAVALRQVVRAASSDDARPVLTGVLMAAEEQGLRLVATDSYRLAMRDLPGTTPLASGQRVLVPSRALTELQRLLGSGGVNSPDDAAGGIMLRVGDLDASFEIGKTRLTTRLLDQGQYPNYAGLIQSRYPNQLTVGREAFLEATRRVKLMVRDVNTAVRVALRAGGIELSVNTPDLGQASEELDAKYEDTEMVIAFNPTYLIDGLEALTGDEVTLEVQDNSKAAALRGPETPSYLYLLMPVRVS